MKKIVSVCLLILAMANMSAMPALAAEEAIPPAYVQGGAAPYYLTVSGCNASISVSGTTVSVTAYANYGSSYTAKYRVYIERSVNGTSWGNTTLIGSGSGSVGSINYNGSKSVTRGFYYRAKATVTVYDGSSVVESATFTSSSQYVG